MNESPEFPQFSSALPAAGTDVSDLLEGILAALPGRLALLDEDGVILAVNRAWCDFADANGLNDPTYGVGQTYFAACDTERSDDADLTQMACSGLRQLLAGERSTFTLEYPCHSPVQQRWFLLRASGFQMQGKRYGVVLHEDISSVCPPRPELTKLRWQQRTPDRSRREQKL